MTRVAYVSLVMSPTVGIMRKLDGQAAAARRAGIPIDYYWVGKAGGVDKESCYNFVVHEVGGESRWKIRLQQVRFLNELAGKYSSVVLRYPLWDPIIMSFLRQRKKYVLEMHSDYLAELKVQKDWRLHSERIFGHWIRQFGGVIAVTPSLLRTVVDRYDYRGPIAFVPNSLDVEAFYAPESALVPVASRPIKFVWVASEFYVWHGLELALESIQELGDQHLFELHLVGKLSEDQRRLANKVANVIVHGTMDAKALNDLYVRMDAGIGSLNLESKSLTEATPLKIREYLAAGLPVVSGSKDPALPPEFRFEYVMEDHNFLGAVDFVAKQAGITRKSVRESARPFIDAVSTGRMLVEFAERLAVNR